MSGRTEREISFICVATVTADEVLMTALHGEVCSLSFFFFFVIMQGAMSDLSPRTDAYSSICDDGLLQPFAICYQQNGIHHKPNGETVKT